MHGRVSSVRKMYSERGRYVINIYISRDSIDMTKIRGRIQFAGEKHSRKYGNSQQSGLNVYCVRPRIVFAWCRKRCARAIERQLIMVRKLSREKCDYIMVRKKRQKKLQMQQKRQKEKKLEVQRKYVF